MKRILGNTYTPTIGEECANTISHGVMAILTLFTIPFAILWAFHLRNSYLDAVGVSIYMISIFSMFSVSTLYHMMPEGTSIKEKWHLFDHIFIYVAIAGCYTPPSLSIIGGTWGIVVVVLQWTIVLLGTFYKIFSKKPRQFVSLAIYISMGWMIVLFLPTLLKNAGMEFLFWLILGGLFYTIGAVIYAKKSFKYYHFVWHMFINFAAVSQFIAFVFYLN